MLFTEIIGQNQVKQQLIRQVKENRISHAQLFLGVEGSGNLPLAIAYARYIFCKEKGAEDSCGNCDSCIKFNKLIHPDVHFVFPVNTTKKVTGKPKYTDFTAEWREAVLENPYQNLYQWLQHIGIENKQGIINTESGKEINRLLHFKSYEGGYKIAIIWMAEKLHHSTANKLLKMIEEPPDKTLIILVANDHEMILPTILSRTQLIKVNPISEDKLTEAIVKNYGTEKEAAMAVARLADGNYLKAIEVATNEGYNAFNREKFIEWMRICYKADVVNTIHWVGLMAQHGREDQKSFLSYALYIIRECLMMNYGDDTLVKMDKSEQEFGIKFRKFIHNGNCFQLAELLNQAQLDIERNAQPKILLLDLSFKVMKLLKASPVEA